jgi:protein TonB
MPLLKQGRGALRVTFSTPARVDLKEKAKSTETLEGKIVRSASRKKQVEQNSELAESSPNLSSLAEGVQSPVMVSGLSMPEYPLRSREKNEEGRVVFRVLVSPSGEPEEISLLSSSGYKRLDSAARRALEDAEFSPATRGGNPVVDTKEIAFRFSLDDFKYNER